MRQASLLEMLRARRAVEVLATDPARVRRVEVYRGRVDSVRKIRQERRPSLFDRDYWRTGNAH